METGGKNIKGRQYTEKNVGTRQYGGKGGTWVSNSDIRG